MRLVLHAGLHRAGSSSIQSVLQDLSAALARDRVHTVTQTMANLPEHRAFKLLRGHKVAALGLAPVRDRLNNHFQTLAAGCDTIVFSDENMPGFMPGKRQAALAHAHDLAELLAALRRDHEVHVVMVLREHVGYLRSVHNFRLARSESGDFTAFARTLDLGSVQFAPVLEAISEAVGPDNMTVHGFESLSSGQAGGVLASIGQFAGSPQLARARMPKANISRNAGQLAMFRALNSAGVFVPLRIPRQRLTNLIGTIAEFPDCGDAAFARLLDFLRAEAVRLPFAITSEERLRMAVRLHGKGVARLLPGMTQAALRKVLRTCAAYLDRDPALAAGDEECGAELWPQFTADREKIAAEWLPGWEHLTAPGKP